MRFFTYSPIDFNDYTAYERAEHYLDERVIVHVTNNGCTVSPVVPGERPRALPDTYIVRVEQDSSLRIVEKRFN